MQPVRLVGTKLREPVVVDTEYRPLQLGIGHPEQPHPQCPVKHLGMNAVDVLVLQPLGGIPSRGPSRLIAGILQVLTQLLAAAPGTPRPRNG